MNSDLPRRIQAIDSHTGGEPTRVIIDGAPVLDGLTMEEKRASLQRDHDWLRSASVCEPRGHDAMVGALLCESAREDCIAGVVFFNNVACLNGCIHGTIGLVETLAHLGRLAQGEHGIETPVGVVRVQRAEDGVVSVRNVRSYRHAADVVVPVSGYGEIRGDVAWGGNWFFLVGEGQVQVPVDFRNLEALTRFAWAVRQALGGAGITGENGAEIDHVEVFGPPADPARADSKNFVLCPGKAYDRSPCGTGTSAKVACLHADGNLLEGDLWRQAGILDTVFEGKAEGAPEGGVFPTVSGSAFVTASTELIVDPADPFGEGIPFPGF